MRTLNIVFGIAATLSTFAHGSGYTEPAFKLMYNNQSSLFGYQLYGSHLYNTTEVCGNPYVASHHLWDLDNFRIQRVFCDQLSDDTDDYLDFDIVKQNVRFFSTGLFITHLWYAFDLSRYPNATNITIATSTHPFAHLCAVLQPAYLEAFDLDSTRIRSAFCSASNLTSLPPTPTNITAISDDVLANYKDTISTLFAYLLISSSRNSTEADTMCTETTARQPEVENSGLRGPKVYHVACGRDGRRMDANESGAAMQLWTTKAFLAILENASDDGYWQPWLCRELDERKMNIMGLLGAGVLREVCGKGRLGDGGCGYDETY